MNLPPVKIREAKKGTCSRILTPKQVGPICWFMATFVAMFYSQRSRKLLLEASKGWNNKRSLYALLKHVLDDKYLKEGSRESEDYKKFSDNTFGKILSYLNIENNKIFPYDPKKVTGGFSPEVYVGKLYKLLNIDYKMFHYSIQDNTVVYSENNDDYELLNYTIKKRKIEVTYDLPKLMNLKTYKYVENNYAPPILIIMVNDKVRSKIYDVLLTSNKLDEGYMKEQLKSMNEQIFYNGKEYNLDAVILANWNINDKNGHAIAGITCKKGKYVYNGWTRTSMDPVMAKNITREIPCELMKYDWNIIKNNDFCLNTTKCIPELLRKKLKVRDICFNFSKGERFLIYVRKDAKPDTSADSDTNVLMNVVKSPPKPPIKPPKSPIKPPKSPKKPPKSPKKPPKSPKKPPKSPKICPEGKVLNPKTNRCILIRLPKLPKKCPDGKVLNPKTNRCILIRLPKLPKKCPDGKVLNPKTGRCILIKNAKAKVVAKAKVANK